MSNELAGARIFLFFIQKGFGFRSTLSAMVTSRQVINQAESAFALLPDVTFIRVREGLDYTLLFSPLPNVHRKCLLSALTFSFYSVFDIISFCILAKKSCFTTVIIIVIIKKIAHLLFRSEKISGLNWEKKMMNWNKLLFGNFCKGCFFFRDTIWGDFLCFHRKACERAADLMKGSGTQIIGTAPAGDKIWVSNNSTLVPRKGR